MGQKQVKNTNNMIDQNQSTIRQQQADFNNYYAPIRNEEHQFANNARNDIYQGYKNLTDKDFVNSQFGAGGGSGGPATYTAPTLTLNSTLAGLKGDYGTLKQGAQDALTGYNEFAKTGGYSDADISNIRSRSNSTIPSFYEALRNRMSQKANAAGGNLAGIFSAASDRMARQQAQGASAQAEQTEMDLSDRIRAGRQWGIAGQSDLGKTGLAGLTGIGQEEQRIQDANAQAAASAANANASARAAYNQDQARLYMAGLSGMNDIYQETPGNESRIDDLYNGNIGRSNSQYQSGIDTRAQYNPNRSLGERMAPFTGLAGGIIGGITGGGGGAIGSIFNRQRPNPTYDYSDQYNY